MINLKEMKVDLGAGQIGDIIRFDTWWNTPFGMLSSLEAAKIKMEENVMPYELIRPITVAVCKNGLYEPWI